MNTKNADLINETFRKNEENRKLIEELIQKVFWKTEDTKNTVKFSDVGYDPLIVLTIRNNALNKSMKIEWKVGENDALDVYYIYANREQADELWSKNHFDQTYKRNFFSQNELNEKIDLLTGYMYYLLLAQK